jgi:hypothetical protein
MSKPLLLLDFYTIAREQMTAEAQVMLMSPLGWHRAFCTHTTHAWTLIVCALALNDMQMG